jgi:DNA-binding beta-propeller fold protein YncE
MRIVPLLSVAIWLGVLPWARAGETNSLVLVKTIPLAEVTGGFNHMSADGAKGQLFATATTIKTVEIVDVKSGKLARSLPGDGAAAALFAPEFNQLYVTRNRKVCIYDGDHFDLVTNVDLPGSVDELEYNPAAKQLYIGCMTSNNTAIAIIEVPDGKLEGEIKLSDKPQGFAAEQKGSRLYVNVPRRNEVVVLDVKSQSVIANWALMDAGMNYPMALDEADHRLFVGCRRPARLVVLDTGNGREVASVPIDRDTDDMSYDAVHRRIYVASGAGFVDVIKQLDADHYQASEQISAPAGSRNCTFSAAANEFYLAIPRRGNQGAEILVYKTP